MQIDNSVLSHHIIPRAAGLSSQERSFVRSIKLFSSSTTGEQKTSSDFYKVIFPSFVPLEFALPL